jgi:hypothetical protein
LFVDGPGGDLFGPDFRATVVEERFFDVVVLALPLAPRTLGHGRFLSKSWVALTGTEEPLLDAAFALLSGTALGHLAFVLGHRLGFVG